MLQSSFDSIRELRNRLKGLYLLWDIDSPSIWLHSKEGGHTDDHGEAVFLGGNRRVVHIGNKYLTVDLEEEGLCKIYIAEDYSETYWVSFDF